MASSKILIILFVCMVIHVDFHVSTADAQIYDSWSSASAAAMSVYPNIESIDLELGDFEEGADNEAGNRRSLYWKKTYYISYGAMLANRVPCPPGSGRSYYTHDCNKARGPAHPYTRGCSCITRCRR